MKGTANITRRSCIRLFGGAMASAVLAGCSSREEGSQQAAGDAEVQEAAQTPGDATDEASPATVQTLGKSIVIVWSWSGNTLTMAERIAALTGAELHRLVAADPYPQDYDQTADRAKKEQDEGVYPEVANPVLDWESYDTVYFGYPIWWYALPMICQGFVTGHDWSGKTVVPFNSHEGSGDGGTYDDLRDMCGTTVLDGLAIRGTDVAGSLDQVDAWLAGLAE